MLIYIDLLIFIEHNKMRVKNNKIIKKYKIVIAVSKKYQFYLVQRYTNNSYTSSAFSSQDTTIYLSIYPSIYALVDRTMSNK